MDVNNFNALMSNEKIVYAIARTHHDKFTSISNQIQLQLVVSDESKKKNLPSDIKLCISHHLKALDENEIHYDQIQLELIFNYIDNVREEDRILLTKYALRKLKNFDHEDHIDFCLEKLNLYERTCLKSKGGFSAIKRLYLWSKSGFLPISISLFAFFGLFLVVLLPAPYSWMSLFKITYLPISDNYYFNHFLNALGLFCGLFEDIKIIPKSILGLFIMIISKLGFILYVINVLVDQLLKKLNK